MIYLCLYFSLSVICTCKGKGNQNSGRGGLKNREWSSLVINYQASSIYIKNVLSISPSHTLSRAISLSFFIFPYVNTLYCRFVEPERPEGGRQLHQRAEEPPLRRALAQAPNSGTRENPRINKLKSAKCIKIKIKQKKDLKKEDASIWNKNQTNITFFF